MEVDESTLADPYDPIRMKFGCRAGFKVVEHFLVCVNGQGYRIRVEVEKPNGQNDSGSPPQPPPRNSKEDGDDDLMDRSSDDDKDEWDGRRGVHGSKEKEKGKDSEKGKSHTDTNKSGGSKTVDVPISPAASRPKASSAPPINQYGTFLGHSRNDDELNTIRKEPAHVMAQPSITTATGSAPMGSPSNATTSVPGANSFVTPSKAASPAINPNGGEQDRERERERRSKANADRPARVRPEETVVSQPDFTDESGEEEDSAKATQLQEEGVVPALAATVTRAPRSKAIPVSTQRKSARGEGQTEGHVLDRAVQCTKEKKGAGTSSLADFTVLASFSDDHLLRVARDSCVVFDSAAVPPAELLSIFHANEIAQAKLAMAREAAAAKLAEAQEKEKEKEAQGQEKDKELQVDMAGATSPVISPTMVRVGARPITKPGPTRRERKKYVAPPHSRKPYTRQARAKGMVS